MFWVVIELTRLFVRLPSFEKQCDNMGLDENDIMEIENAILSNPKIGDVVVGTGGVRKFRIALSNNKGKSGGARIVYIDFTIYAKVYFLAVFPKSEKENLTKAEKNELKSLVKTLEKEASKNEKG